MMYVDFGSSFCVLKDDLGPVVASSRCQSSSSGVLNGCHVAERVSRVWAVVHLLAGDPRQACRDLCRELGRSCGEIHFDSLESGNWSVYSDPQVLPPGQGGSAARSLVQISTGHLFLRPKLIRRTICCCFLHAVVLCSSPVALPTDWLRHMIATRSVGVVLLLMMAHRCSLSSNLQLCWSEHVDSVVFTLCLCLHRAKTVPAHRQIWFLGCVIASLS